MSNLLDHLKLKGSNLPCFYAWKTCSLYSARKYGAKFQLKNIWKSRFLPILASGDLGSRIWGHAVPLNRGRWATFGFSHDPKKRVLLWFFDTPKSTYQLMASAAAEAGLNRPKTSALMNGGCMQSFDLLALKLRPCIGYTGNDRRLFVVFEMYN